MPCPGGAGAAGAPRAVPCCAPSPGTGLGTGLGTGMGTGTGGSSSCSLLPRQSHVLIHSVIDLGNSRQSVSKIPHPSDISNPSPWQCIIFKCRWMIRVCIYSSDGLWEWAVDGWAGSVCAWNSEGVGALGTPLSHPKISISAAEALLAPPHWGSVQLQLTARP